MKGIKPECYFKITDQTLRDLIDKCIELDP